MLLIQNKAASLSGGRFNNYVGKLNYLLIVNLLTAVLSPLCTLTK